MMSVPSPNGRVQPGPSRNGNIRDVVRRSRETAASSASGFGASDPSLPDPEADFRALLARCPTYSGTELLAAQFAEEWIWRGLFVPGEPATISGQMKTMKTTLAAGLAMRAALGVAAFGVRYPYAGPEGGTRVLYLSGESGAAQIQRMIERQLRELRRDPVIENLRVVARCPRLDVHPELLEHHIDDHGATLVFIDPVYRLLGQQDADMKDLAQSGGTFDAITSIICGRNATPVFVDHNLKYRSNKTDDPHSPPTLDDMKVGAAAFTRQWVLIGRRAKFDPEADTVRLWVTTGGGDGQADEFGINIDEGPRDPQTRRRNGWCLTVLEPDRAREFDRDFESRRNAQVADEKMARFRAAVIEALESSGDRRTNQTRLHAFLKTRVSGFAHKTAFTEALTLMLSDANPLICERAERGSRNEKVYELTFSRQAQPTPRPAAPAGPAPSAPRSRARTPQPRRGE